MNRNFLSRLSTALLCGGMLTTAGAFADERDARIEQLQQQVDSLETRLQALEQRFTDGVPLNRALRIEARPNGWRNPENWTFLAKGMPKEEVERFLGEPDRVRRVRKFEFWDYGDGKAALYMDRLKSWDVPAL